MTKKDFISKCDFHVYVGGDKHNVIYYDNKDYDVDSEGRGYKFGVALDIQHGTKADLIKHAYNWIVRNINLPYFVRYKFAATDNDRFKVPISLNF